MNERWLRSVPMKINILQIQVMIHIVTKRNYVNYNQIFDICLLIHLILLKRYKYLSTDYSYILVLKEGDHLFHKKIQ